MKSSPISSPRHWRAIVLQLAICLATFGAGWYLAGGGAPGAAASTAKNASAKKSSAIKYSQLVGADLAKARAALEKVYYTSGPQSAKAMRDLLAGLDAGAVKDLLEDLVAHPLDGNYVMSELLDRWTELDPQGAFDWSQKLKDPRLKNNQLNVVLRNWADKSPAEALAALRSLPPGMQAASTGYGGFGPPSSLFSSVFSAWAQTDPAAAVAAAQSLPASTVRNQSLSAIAGAWAEQDPSAALAWAKALPAGSAKEGAVNAAVQSMSQQDPKGAADIASTLPATTSRDTLLQNIARNWAQQDPQAAMAWASQSLTGASRDTAVSAAFTQMTFTDPAAAANLYLNQLANPIISSKNINTFEASYSWVQQDSQAAINFALTLPTSNDGVPNGTVEFRNEILQLAISQQSQHDPVGTAALLQNFTSDPNFSKLAAPLSRNWATTDPAAALTWAQSLPAGDAQNTTVAGVITSIAQIDPQTAWNDLQLLTGKAQDTASTQILSLWAMQQPDQAATALSSLPAGANLNSATSQVASSWLKQDPAAATQWIDTLPAGTARDGAVTQIITTVGGDDPAGAYNWATTISDPVVRATQVVNLTKKWAAKDAAAAADAAQNALSLTGLTNAQRTALQKIANPAP